MILNVEQKFPGRKKDVVMQKSLEIEGCPRTIAELIKGIVECLSRRFDERSKDSPANENDDVIRIRLSEEEIDQRSECGKIAFDVIYNRKKVDSEKAVEIAFQGYRDGLFKLFLNGNLLGNAEDEINIQEGDTLTVIKLTMLSGRMY